MARDCFVRHCSDTLYCAFALLLLLLRFATQVELTASDWDECGMWLTALKRLIKIRQTMG